MAVSKAAEQGAKAIVCASTGNTSAAAAAYAARAGMTAFVLIPEGKIAMGKLQSIRFAYRGRKRRPLKLLKRSAGHPIITVYRLATQATFPATGSASVKLVATTQNLVRCVMVNVLISLIHWRRPGRKCLAIRPVVLHPSCVTAKSKTRKQ